MWSTLFVRRVIVVSCLLLVALVGCAPERETVAPATRRVTEGTPRPATATVAPAEPSATAATATLVATAAATATPIATLTPTAVAAPAEPLVIAPENAARLRQLAQFGSGRIDSITWSPDGATFAVGTSQGIDLFDAQTLQKTQSIRPEDQSALGFSIRFSPSGEYLIVGMGSVHQGRETLWDASSGQYMRDLFDAFVTDFSPDGEVIYFEWAGQQLVWQDPASGENTRAIALPYVPRAYNVVSGTAVELTEDGTLRLYDLESGELRHTLEHGVILDAIAFSPGGDLLATGSRDGFIRVWDVRSGVLLHEMDEQAEWVNTVLFSPDGRLLASSSGESTVRLWDVVTGQLLRELPRQRGYCSYGYDIAAFSPDGREFATTSGNRILFFDTAGGTVQRTLDNGYCFGSDVAFYPDSSALLIAGGHRVYTVNAASGEVVAVQETDLPVVSIAVSPDGERLAWGGGDGETVVRLWDLTQGQPLYTIQMEGQAADKVSFSPDGRLLAVQSGLWRFEPMVQLVESDGGALLASYPVYSFAWSPDGRLLATSNAEEAAVELWDTATLQLVQRLEGLALLGFGGDGSILAERRSAEGQATIGWWDSDSGELLRPFAEKEYIPSRVLAFSPDNRLFLGIPVYGYTTLWDVDTGEKMLWESSAAATGAFSPDGRLLATISSDGTMRLWGLPSDAP